MTHPDGTFKSIGKYDILEKVGEGGMASVFKARQRDTGAIVAIKIIKSGQLDQRSLQRFELEIQATRNLRHPHIVRGLDFGQEGSTAFLVMEYVDGENLGMRIERKGRLAEDEALRFIIQVGLALHHAHQQGFIHRDVKPDNILITPDGQAKLTDLGLVKNREADLDLTRPATGLGTPNFIAPEQFENAKHADVLCDVYALGATLYQAVTGVLPFAAKNNVTILKKKLTNDITAPRDLVASLSRRLDLAIRRALRSDPTQRFSTCLEFLEVLAGRPLADEICPADLPVSALVAPLTAEAPHGSDRRTAPRFATDVVSSCQPIGGEPEEWSAVVQDISATGVRLVVERRFEPCTTLLVRLLDTRPWIPTMLLCRVVRVELDPSQNWTLGCVFGAQLTADEIVALQ